MRPLCAPRIPRTYYAKRLLEHGPLTAREFREITGWPARTCASVVYGLIETELARRSGGKIELIGGRE